MSGLRALCLPGCGCRGAFQHAVMARLAARGESFELVSGASSGSICGAVYVSGLSEQGPSVWRALAKTRVWSPSYLRSERSFFGMTKVLRDALTEFVPEPGIASAKSELLVSTTRLSALLKGARQRNARRPIEEIRGPGATSRVRALAESCGALCVHSNRQRQDFHDIIVASCTIPILYARLTRIDGEVHVDGGASDNAMLSPLLDRGATDITVVTPYLRGAVSATLFEDEHPPVVPPGVRLRLIYPERPLSLGRFDFDPGRLEEALTMPHVEQVIEPTPMQSGPDAAV